jgi:hypothetical protein
MKAGVTASEFERMMKDMGAVMIDLDEHMPVDPNEKHQVVWMLSKWAHEHGLTYESLGFIPQFMHTDDPRSAKEQIDEAYQHGGGWHQSVNPWVIHETTITANGEGYNLIATAKLRGEEIRLYEASWTAIIHEDGSFEVARLD